MSYPLLQQIMESINDKGLMKALFITGIPAAGKSHTLSQITDGAIAPRVVNTDKVIEFFHRKGLIDMRNKAEQRTVLDQAKQTTAEQLYHYINGLLPIVVDSTSANEQNVLRRKGLLQSFGYDVAMVWVNVDLETALQRAAGRDRAVDADFIKRAHELAAENKEYFKANFPIFIEIDNSSGVIDNQAVAAAVKKATQFFSAPLANPTGRRIIDTLKQSGQKNITPTVYSDQELRPQTDMWYPA
jgi:predicted kinase